MGWHPVERTREAEKAGGIGGSGKKLRARLQLARYAPAWESAMAASLLHTRAIPSVNRRHRRSKSSRADRTDSM